MSECRERCAQELEELRKHQTERVELLLQQQEEKEQKMKLENQKKKQQLEESLRQLERENREKEQALKAENERVLSVLLEENESQEALMLAKHEGEERAARKADQLQTERSASASNQPQIPECPVGVLKHLKAHTLLPQQIFLRILWLSCALSICHYKKKTNYIAKLCQSIFQRQIALYSPCRRSVGRRRHVLLPLILPP